jgi:Tol biopolymer transport system component
MLTKGVTNEGMPSWSPRGDQIACLYDRDGSVDLALVGNFGDYLAQLREPDGVRVFDRPQATRVAPRENLRRVRATPRP